MPRPRPLQNIATGRPLRSDYHLLTPRTPHSLAGRAEAAVDELELDNLGDEDYKSYLQQQSRPLLVSSADDNFPSVYRGAGDDHDFRKGSKNFDWSRVPLVLGCIAATGLLILILVSMNRPDALDHFISSSAETEDSHTFSAPDDLQDIPISIPKYPIPSNPPNPNILSYENYSKFPLLPSEYRHECAKLMHGFMREGGGYWDRNGPSSMLDVVHHDDMTDYHLPENEATRVCTSTITYMLDGRVGLLADLSLLAQVAGMAREQNRTFLVDDTYWNRGKWTDHFQDVRSRQPGPEPGCRAPPPEELVACPRTARHWVLNSRTAKFHLGHAFSEAFEDPYGHGLNRLKPIFSRARESFTKTIRPNAHNAALIRSAREELAAISLQNTTEAANPEAYFGIHIRRGDRHPYSWPFHNGYVPMEHFVQAIQDTRDRLDHPGFLDIPQDTPTSVVYVATDSPIANEEFTNAVPPHLTLFSLSRSKNPDLSILQSSREYIQKEFNALTETARVAETKGIIVDFALLSGAWAWDGDVIPIATVCTISSNICKMTAVGLGWERAFGYGNGRHEDGNINESSKRWVEIDNNGAIAPIWQAFELFT
ncbi:hypothetical protein JAAARDRAFT_29085 [Jaapia argillacea MUCL 33604]|uniref:Uncharacterized protein n=1 Tax=Jaapia argillacea MUCL 33604 TaxID=933084 RepID=A0A067Q7R3_9AGAM|nr:hypothetical protein JAAARDRAFT_29085 [Jaapia argillacea MUCL 33604]